MAKKAFPKRLYVCWVEDGDIEYFNATEDGASLAEQDGKRIVAVYDLVGRADVVNTTTVHERPKK